VTDNPDEKPADADKFTWQDGDLVEQTDEEYEAARAARDAAQKAAAERLRKRKPSTPPPPEPQP